MEAVIEERIARLDAQLREILNVASVEGEAFTARVVASNQEVVERQLLHLLSAELEKRHRLVHESALGRQPIGLASRVRRLHVVPDHPLLRGTGGDLVSGFRVHDHGRQLDRIELESERLDTLIGQMLQLSQLRALPTLPREPVDLTILLTEMIEDARLEASAAEKRVEWSAGEPLIVDGDHALLRSAIENVLRNAVRFTRRATSVAVTAVRHGSQAVVAIEDQGPGVPQAELERIFEPFYRVAEARDRDSGGTGLGLAITSRVVSLYGGLVRARNARGAGLLVEISLPLRPA